MIELPVIATLEDLDEAALIEILSKPKNALVKQYGCKRVKFTVYEKDGKAALKATPIRE